MIYRHTKTGHMYKLLHDNARHSETLELLCVYQRIENGEVWVRPHGMFFEKVMLNGVVTFRFEPELEEVDPKPRC